MPPRRISQFKYFEFEVVIAEQDGIFTAIGRNTKADEVGRSEGNNEDDVKTEIKSILAPLSDEFISFESAINLFRRAFPGGFESDFFFAHEDYDKRSASDFVRANLSKENLEVLISEQAFEAVAKLAKQAVSKTNVISPFEMMRFGDMLKDDAKLQTFSHNLFDLLYGENFNEAFDSFAALLKTANAASWPLATYFPYMAFPDQHMYLKPEVTKECAWRLGFTLDYESSPNIATYNSLLELTDHIRTGIQIQKPRDNIDIQSFMYVVGSEGYVAEAEAERLKLEMAE